MVRADHHGAVTAIVVTIEPRTATIYVFVSSSSLHGNGTQYYCVGQYTITTLFITRAGLVFSSESFPPGSALDAIFTAGATIVIVLSTTSFAALLIFEVYRSVKLAKLYDLARRVELEAVEKSLFTGANSRLRSRFLRRSTPSPIGTGSTSGNVTRFKVATSPWHRRAPDLKPSREGGRMFTAKHDLEGANGDGGSGAVQPVSASDPKSN